MLDLGFRPQLTSIFELLPERRQNIMFSATMTADIDVLISAFFFNTKRISIALSGTPLDNIKQGAYLLPNFHTKVNLLKELIKDKDLFSKVLIFVYSKKHADLLYELMEESYGSESCVVHSNKSQNYRIRSVEQFQAGDKRILIATDVMARGLDIDKITHVINIDVPDYPENYMHRIGRTGRAEQEGTSLLFYTEKENLYKEAIEQLMGMRIDLINLPDNIEESNLLLPEERPDDSVSNVHKIKIQNPSGEAFHEKKEKNKKHNQGGSYRKKLAQKYKKPKTRGDKNANKKKKR